MKPAPDLVRAVLEHIEETVSTRNPIFSSQLEFPGYTPLEVNEHIAICEQEGLLAVENVSTFGRTDFLVQGLTATGRRELERLRKLDSPLSGIRSVLGAVYKPVYSWILLAAAIVVLLGYFGIRIAS